VGETGTVADPIRQPGVREKCARQRHATNGDQRGPRSATTAHGARGRSQPHREDRTLRATHGRWHCRRGRRRGVVLRRHR